ncbi:MAG: hypothetical protein KIT22_11770 [Verrucomicrobiae bacterium]|nr:hypothetical protein [Verrucomicrobiae bacterium]
MAVRNVAGTTEGVVTAKSNSDSLAWQLQPFAPSSSSIASIALEESHSINSFMSEYNNPKWWTSEHDSTWEKTKAAFKRDWDQTLHDLGGRTPDTNQGADDTLKQAVGKQPIPPRGQPTYEEQEPAYRFGYGARSHYGREHTAWDASLEEQLREDWTETYPSRELYWDTDRQAIRYGWNYYRE